MIVKIKVLILLRVIFISIFLDTFCTEQNMFVYVKKKPGSKSKEYDRWPVSFRERVDWSVLCVVAASDSEFNTEIIDTLNNLMLSATF